MKITQPASKKLIIYPELHAPWMPFLLASAVLWGILIWQIITRGYLSYDWSNFNFGDWISLNTWNLLNLIILPLAIILTARLFTDEFIEVCTFDRGRKQVNLEFKTFLGQRRTVQKPFSEVRDIQIVRKSGDRNDYFYIVLRLRNRSKISPIQLMERLEAEQPVIEYANRIREFLDLPPNPPHL